MATPVPCKETEPRWPATWRSRGFTEQILVATLAVIVSGCAGSSERRDWGKGTSRAQTQALRAGANVAPNLLTREQAIARLEADRDAYWQNARREEYKSTQELRGQDEAEEQTGRPYRKLLHGDKTKKQIALTFDDGPHPQFTPRILALLQRDRVPATFFVVGKQAERYPELIRAQMKAGHHLANHTYHHVSLPKIPEAYVDDEIRACGNVLQSITGKPCHLFRPPGGEYNRAIAQIAQNLGYTTVLWTNDPGDYASPGEDVILQRTLKKATPGGIILLHDGVEQTIKILPRLIATLRKQGYTFVTIDAIIAERDIRTQARVPRSATKTKIRRAE